MTCPLCRERRARRGCPALGHEICSVCCGTKRLVEIQCPAGCPYLAAAREHPAATTVRQQQRDIGLLVHFVRDLSRRQSDLFTGLSSFLQRYVPLDLHPIIDDDVAEAAGSLAATFETAARGLIYEHRPASLPAERLALALKPVIAEAAKGPGTAFERDAAVTLRQLEHAAREARSGDASNPRAFLDLLGRVFHQRDDRDRSQTGGQEPPRLIVP